MVAGRWSLSVLVNDSNWLMQDAVVVLASVGSFGLCRHFEESNREEAVWVMGGLCSSRSHLTRSIPKQEKIVTCFRKNGIFSPFQVHLVVDDDDDDDNDHNDDDDDDDDDNDKDDDDNNACVGASSGCSFVHDNGQRFGVCTGRSRCFSKGCRSCPRFPFLPLGQGWCRHR